MYLNLSTVGATRPNTSHNALCWTPSLAQMKLNGRYDSVNCYASANVWQEANYRRESVCKKWKSQRIYL